MNQTHIGARVKALREAAGMSQDDIKDLLGLNSRQIVGQIENGIRRLTAVELVAVMKRFDVSLERMTNPFLLMGKSAFPGDSAMLRRACSTRSRKTPESGLAHIGR